jgi:Nif-specific regulatory protein
MLRHRWPGNVRELENCIERAVLLAQDEVIESQVLPMAIQGAVSADLLDAAPRRMEDFGKHSLDELVGSYEKTILAEALTKCDNNVAAVARLLASTPRIIGYKIKQHQLL